LTLGVRPEHIALSDAAPIRGRIFAVEYLGTNQIVTIDLDRAKVKARLPARTAATVGDNVGLAFQAAKLVIFNAATGRAMQSALFEGANIG
jgi:multiple sugar transport system ATP-binding protein